MRFEDANEMLKPGYLPFEFGYQELEDGKWVVAGLTRMPGCPGKDGRLVVLRGSATSTGIASGIPATTYTAAGKTG